MACYNPLDAWQPAPGGRLTIYKRHVPVPPALTGRNLKLPCNRCIGCKLERSRQWAVRLMHEAQLHEETCFLTLTYDDKKTSTAVDEFADSPSTARRPGLGSARIAAMPPSRSQESLDVRHLQLFMKRLRAEANALRGSTRIRFYGCGEYGDKLGRPHYHIALFGEEFAGDRFKHSEKHGYITWRSPRLEALWPHGYSAINDLTIETAAYIARYVTKKMTGKKADEHYKRVDQHGNYYWIEPEFSVMSRRPGIGREWFAKFQTDVYPHDHVIMRGMKSKPPRYYDKLLALIDEGTLTTIKEAREAGINHSDNTPARLAVREKVELARLALKKRNLENR